MPGGSKWLFLLHRREWEWDRGREIKRQNKVRIKIFFFFEKEVRIKYNNKERVFKWSGKINRARFLGC